MYPVQYNCGPVQVYGPPASQTNQVTSPGYGMAPPPTLSPGYNVAPPPPSPGYGVAPPPHSPGYSVAPPLPSPGGYSMPPPFHQTNYKSTSGTAGTGTGRHSPTPHSQELLPTGKPIHNGQPTYNKYSTSPGQMNNNNMMATSPNLLQPPPRSPNLGYQPGSPTFSYFSSNTGSRQRTLIEVPRIDNGPTNNRLTDLPVSYADEGQRNIRRQSSYGGQPSSTFQPLPGNIPKTRPSSVQEHLQLYEPNNQGVAHGFNPNPKSTSQQQAFEPSSNSLHPGYEPLNLVIKQGYDQPPGLGAQQRYDNSTAAVQQGYEQNGQLPQVKKQSYELLSSAVNAYDPASKALQKEYDQSTVQQGFDPNGYYDEYVDQDPDGNIYGTYSRIDGMAYQGYETNGEGGALDAIINIAKSRLDPNVRPFTPSNKMYSNIPSDGWETTESASYQTCESEGQSQADYYEEGFQFNFEQDYDPLPQDPGSLLPNLDTTQDQEDPNNNISTMENKNIISSTNQNNNNSSTIDKNAKMAQQQINAAREKRLKEIQCKLSRPEMVPSPFLHDVKWKNIESNKNTSMQSNSLSANFVSNVDGRREIIDSESRHLVSGLEQSLHKWVENQQLQMLHQQASFIEKIRRRMAVNGHMRPPHHQDPSAVSAPKMNTGGIFTQDLTIPPEYLMSSVIGDRIRPINIRQEHTDLLFFIFYTMHGDALQLVAASLLFERGWRFHKQQRIWLARWPGVRPEEKTNTFEKGLYQYFDLASWKRIPGWFRLDYCHLVEKTIVPEDLKTMYTKYSSVLQEVNSSCRKSIALHGFNAKMNEDMEEITGVKYLSCIM